MSSFAGHLPLGGIITPVCHLEVAPKVIRHTESPLPTPKSRLTGPLMLASVFHLPNKYLLSRCCSKHGRCVLILPEFKFW